MTRMLGHQYDIFRIGLGAMPLSLTGRPTEAEAIQVIACFVELGGNFIDTANVYGLDHADRGHNEKLIHKALTVLGCADKVLVGTKGGATRPNGGWDFGEGHPKQLRKACEDSLKNLNVAAHSLYYFHGPDPVIPLEDSLGELILLKDEGKIEHLGISNVTPEELQMASAMTRISAVQNRCNPFCKGDFNNGLITFCKDNNILYIPYCPLGGWSLHAELALSNLYHDLKSKYAITSHSICLTWLLAKGSHIIPIPGMKKKHQVLMNIQTIDLYFDEDDIKQIDAFPDLYSPKHISVKIEIK